MILVERKCPRASLFLERHKAAWQGRAILRNQGIWLFCSVPKASYVALTRKVIGVITTRRCCDRIGSSPGCGLSRGNSASILLAFYRPPAFSMALTIILFASSPERFVTVKWATDCRWRVFLFASTEISVICIATRGARRSIIVISFSFLLAKVSPHKHSSVYVIVVETSTCQSWVIMLANMTIVCWIQCTYVWNRTIKKEITPNTWWF